MTNAIKRGVTTSQLKMRMLQVDVAAATSQVSGFDAAQISSIVKNGAGDFTIILKRPFEQRNSNRPKVFITPLAAGVTFHLSATAYDRVTVVLSSDVDFSIMILGSDYRFNQ